MHFLIHPTKLPTHYTITLHAYFTLNRLCFIVYSNSCSKPSYIYFFILWVAILIFKFVFTCGNLARLNDDNVHWAWDPVEEQKACFMRKPLFVKLCNFLKWNGNAEIKLSKYVWELKEKDINYFINWDIAMEAQKYVCGSRKCDLCICEKLLIARADPNVLLNKRDELVSKCRHRNKFTLKCFKDR